MSEIAALVGPFYNTDGIARLLNVPPDQISALRDTGDVLGMETSDHVWLYPTYQFKGSVVNRDLTPAIRYLRHAPGWSTGLWFVTPNPDLDGMTALEWIRAGHPTEDVTRAAGHIARQWAA